MIMRRLIADGLNSLTISSILAYMTLISWVREIPEFSFNE